MISKTDIKLIKSLTKKKYRKLHNLFTIEGVRLISEAMKSKIDIKQIFVTKEFVDKPQHDTLMNAIAEKALITIKLDEKELIEITETISPSGILALCKIPRPKNIYTNINDNWLYLDEIRDPGNLGTLLRSTSWFGVHNVALSKNCIDVYNPKVLRGGMGAHFRLSIYENVALSALKENNCTIIGAFQKGENIFNLEPKQLYPWVLVIGNEAFGISQNNAHNIDLKVTIPKIGYGESLNAAVAASILLSYLTKPA